MESTSLCIFTIVLPLHRLVQTLHCLNNLRYAYTAKVFLYTHRFIAFATHAQKVTLLNSTERCWRGGIEGPHGCNYTFSVEL
jgi:hypothetical protein